MQNKYLMAFKEADMKRMGLTETSPGIWEKIRPAKDFQLKTTIKSDAVKKGRPGKDDLPNIDLIETGDGWCKITLQGLIPGLNGKNGLLREHWTKRKQRKERMQLRLLALKPPSFKGNVKIKFTSYVSVLSDDDNNSSKRKIVFDCLVRLGVIEDDSHEFVVPALPKQERCRRKDQKTTIFIEKIK